LARLTEGTALLWKVAELDLEPDTDAVRAGDGADATLDIASIGEGGLVEGSVRKSGRVVVPRRIVDDNGGVTEVLLSWLVAAMPEPYEREVGP
jgi:hypothetical protein